MPRRTLSHKQRADLIADQAVQDAPRLLRVDDLLIDAAGIFDGVLDRLGRDLIEEHAVDFGLVVVENLFQVLANRFAFAIRIGGKQDSVGGSSRRSSVP